MIRFGIHFEYWFILFPALLMLAVLGETTRKDLIHSLTTRRNKVINSD